MVILLKFSILLARARNIQSKPPSDAIPKTGRRVQELPEPAPPSSLHPLQGLGILHYSIFSEVLINVDTNVHAVLDPGSHFRLPIEKARVVARVAGKVYPRPRSNSCKNVQMTRHMPRAVNNID